MLTNMVSFLPFSLPHEFLISRLDSKQIRVGIFQSTPVQHLARLVIHVVGLIHTPSNLTLRSPPYNELPILTTPVTRAKLPLFLRAKPRQVQQVATAPPHTNRPAAPKLEEPSCRSNTPPRGFFVIQMQLSSNPIIKKQPATTTIFCLGCSERSGG